MSTATADMRLASCSLAGASQYKCLHVRHHVFQQAPAPGRRRRPIDRFGIASQQRDEIRHQEEGVVFELALPRLTDRGLGIRQAIQSAARRTAFGCKGPLYRDRGRSPSRLRRSTAHTCRCSPWRNPRAIRADLHREDSVCAHNSSVRCSRSRLPVTSRSYSVSMKKRSWSLARSRNWYALKLLCRASVDSPDRHN